MDRVKHGGKALAGADAVEEVLELAIRTLCVVDLGHCDYSTQRAAHLVIYAINLCSDLRFRQFAIHALSCNKTVGWG